MSEITLGARYKTGKQAFDNQSFVSQWLSNNEKYLYVHFLVVGGAGGAGGSDNSGGSGGGAGGFRSSWSNSSFASNSGRGGTLEEVLYLKKGTYAITVGAGGAAGPSLRKRWLKRF